MSDEKEVVLPMGQVMDGPQSDAETREHLRILEALLFASDAPVDEKRLAGSLPEDVEVRPLLDILQRDYATRGVNLNRVGKAWAFRTAADLAFLLRRESVEPKRLSRAAVETLAIVAYHQPVTRTEIEEIRGVGVSRGTLDLLMELGWIKIGRRRETPGRPVTFLSTQEFLDHFGLENLKDLPGVKELKEAGFLDTDLPETLAVLEPGADEVGDGNIDDLEDEDGEGDEAENQAEREVAAALAEDESQFN